MDYDSLKTTKTSPHSDRSDTCLVHVHNVHRSSEVKVLTVAVGFMFANKKFEQDKKRLAEDMTDAMR